MIKTSLLFFFQIYCCLFFLPAFAQASPASIILDANQITNNPSNVQGFLHGFESVDYDKNRLNLELLMALKPQYWRIGMSGKAGKNHIFARHINPNTKITLVVSDQIAVMRGGYDSLRPWENWERYENEVKSLVKIFQDHQLSIDYWDVWSEPDTKAMWKGTCEQAMETFARTFYAIRSVEPNAKIVGPSVSDIGERGACEESFFNHFLNYIRTKNIPFDAISWHEFNHPEALPQQTNAVRNYFLQSSAFSLPEVHVNEFSGPADDHFPSLALQWLYYLEEAKVNWASRACWQKGCGSGLNWLFEDDSTTPTALYWLHRLYAEMPLNRLQVKTSPPQIVVMAGKNNANKISILIGKIFGASEEKKSPIHLMLKGVKPSSAILNIRRITAKRIQEETVASEIKAHNNELRFDLPPLEDGEVYSVVISGN